MIRKWPRVLVPLAALRLHGRAFWRIQARVAAQGSVIVPLLQVAVLGVAGIELAAHRISPGELLAASQYAVIGAGIGASIGRLSQLARARAGARRVADPLDEPVTAQGVRLLPPGRGCLELRGVTVLSGGERVLDSVDIVIRGGTVVAVVGRSGAGKSLLAALAGRLLDPDAGAVILDGIPVASIDRAELRRAVVYALDRPALFGRTPREAIEFGISRPSATRVLSAARATCHLDPIAAARAESAFAARPGALIVVAHRMSSALHADRVLVLDGACARIGDHAALLAFSPMYRDLVGHWQADHDPGTSVCVTSQPPDGG